MATTPTAALSITTLVSRGRVVRLASYGPDAVGVQVGDAHYLLTQHCPLEFRDCLLGNPPAVQVDSLVRLVAERGW